MLRGLVALAAGAVGAVAMVVVGLPLAAGAVLGGVAALAVWGLIPKDPWKAELADGVSRESLDAAKRKLRAAAMKLENLAHRVRRPRPEAADTLARTGGRIRDLIQHLERDPANLKRLGEMLEQHLPRAEALVERYAAMVARGQGDTRANDELVATEGTLIRLGELVEAQHRALLTDDITELAVDRRVFEELLELDPNLAEDRRRGLASRERETR